MDCASLFSNTLKNRQICSNRPRLAVRLALYSPAEMKSVVLKSNKKAGVKLTPFFRGSCFFPKAIAILANIAGTLSLLQQNSGFFLPYFPTIPYGFTSQMFNVILWKILIPDHVCLYT